MTRTTLRGPLSLSRYRYYVLASALAASPLPFITSADLMGLVFVGVSLGSVGAIVIGLRRNRPELMAPWRWLAVTILAVLAGDISVAIDLAMDGVRADISPADFFYPMSFVPLLICLTQLARRRTPGNRATRLDASIVATGLFTLAWVFVLEPTARVTPLILGHELFALMYPFGDVLVMALLARLTLAGGAPNRALQLFGAGVALMVAADTANAMLTAQGLNAETPPGLLAMCYVLSYVLWGAAVLHPAVVTAAKPSESNGAMLRSRRQVLLCAASLIGPVLLLVQAANQDYHSVPVIAISCIVLFLLVVRRMSGLVKQVQQQSDRLEKMALTDGLTGVGNRRAWEAELDRRITDARRSGETVSVAMMDLDFFKRYNDTYGHQGGDQLLKSTAANWASNLRATDFIARYGGEEFAIVLTGVSPNDAVAVLERVRASTPSGQTVSVGIARWNGREDPSELVRRADAALYLAKSEGRDRVCAAADLGEQAINI